MAYSPSTGSVYGGCLNQVAGVSGMISYAAANPAVASDTSRQLYLVRRHFRVAGGRSLWRM